jgi:hypothetical protein
VCQVACGGRAGPCALFRLPHCLSSESEQLQQSHSYASPPLVDHITGLDSYGGCAAVLDARIGNSSARSSSEPRQMDVEEGVFVSGITFRVVDPFGAVACPARNALVDPACAVR